MLEVIIISNYPATSNFVCWSRIYLGKNLFDQTSKSSSKSVHLDNSQTLQFPIKITIKGIFYVTASLFTFDMHFLEFVHISEVNKTANIIRMPAQFRFRHEKIEVLSLRFWEMVCSKAVKQKTVHPNSWCFSQSAVLTVNWKTWNTRNM